MAESLQVYKNLKVYKNFIIDLYILFLNLFQLRQIKFLLPFAFN